MTAKDTDRDAVTSDSAATDVESRLEALETAVVRQKRHLERQRERVVAMANAGADGAEPIITRRGVLTAGGLLALLGFGTGSAGATATGQIGTGTSPLNTLYTDQLNGGVTGGTALTNLVGSGLTINSGALETTGGIPSKLQTSGSSVTAVQVVDGTVDVSNAGSSATAPNVIAGHPNNNTASSSTHGATISGGGANGSENVVNSPFATVGGGSGNQGSGTSATVPGGQSNTADGAYSFAAGRAADTSGNDGAFVWGDSTSTAVTAGATDEVRFQATGGFVVENGTVDAEGGTVTNSTGALSLTTGSGDLTLNPSGDVDLSGNVLTDTSGGLTIDGSTNNGVTITTNGGDRTLELGVPTSDGSNIAGGNVVAGHKHNTVNNSAVGVVIGGGGSSSLKNTVGGNYATVGGGRGNTASKRDSTVCGGYNNKAKGNYANVTGGQTNKAIGIFATVCGGQGNYVGGQNSTVVGGSFNYAMGDHAFASGNSANANNTGSFVWGDSTITSVDSMADDEVRFQASGGFVIGTSSDMSTGVTVAAGGGSWSSLSSRTAKSAFEPGDSKRVLESVTEMDVGTWRYNGQDEAIRHMGPIAEDFYDAFGLGADERRITNVDADGVAFAAIQGLAEELDDTRTDLDERDERIADLEADCEAKDARIADQRDRIDHLGSKIEEKDEQIDHLESDAEAKDERLTELEAENDRLRDRIGAIEAELGIDTAPGRQGVADD
ncbi:MAG: tail fiber domain-containing protein [Halorientalis sp.]